MIVLPLDELLQFGILFKPVFNTCVMDEVLGALSCVHKVLCIVVVRVLTLVALWEGGGGGGGRGGGGDEMVGVGG